MRMRLATATLFICLSLLISNATCTTINNNDDIYLNISVHDFRPDQIPGIYRNIQLRSGSGVCADGLRVRRVEPLATSSGVFYVIPHQFIELPIIGGGLQKCTSSNVDSDITSSSSTILRRDTQVRVDDSNPLVSAFRVANERFFLGYELGDRVCGRVRLAQESISMWVAPKSLVAVNTGEFTINFKAGFKYIYYFSRTNQACLYRGDANQLGQVTTAATIPPSVSPTPSSAISSPSPVPVAGTMGSTTTSTNTNDISNNVPLDDGSSGANPDINLDDDTLPLEDEESKRVCFPADCRVRLENGKEIWMKDLQIGDKVLVNIKDGNLEYSQVFGFTHRRYWIRSNFVRLEMENEKSIECSKGHYLLINGKIKRAGEVKIGDTMMDAKDGQVSVRRIDKRMKRGLYNPQTYDGRIVVNELIATTYTDAVGELTTGHALLTPLRWMQRIMLSE